MVKKSISRYCPFKSTAKLEGKDGEWRGRDGSTFIGRERQERLRREKG